VALRDGIAASMLVSHHPRLMVLTLGHEPTIILFNKKRVDWTLSQIILKVCFGRAFRPTTGG